MMYEELYRYFIQYKKLVLPGVGTFLLERRPAEIDFANKQINPPSYSTAFHTGSETPSMHFFKWLGETLRITDHDAIIRFNDFVFDVKKQISKGDKIDWPGVGTISKNLGGETKFSGAKESIPERPVPAEKVIREKSEHMVRVGEDQKTSAEMTEMLKPLVEKSSKWWVSALVAVLLALGFIGWYFYEHGMQVASASNTMKLVPVEASDPYQTLP